MNVINNYSPKAKWILVITIQQIVTLSKLNIVTIDALNICQPYSTDILRYM